jgi:hypothetical protein
LGPKFAGLLAKQGSQYLLEDEELAKVFGALAEQGTKAGFEHLKYGEPRHEKEITTTPIKPTKYEYKYTSKDYGHGLYAGGPGGHGLYGGLISSSTPYHGKPMDFGKMNNTIHSIQKPDMTKIGGPQRMGNGLGGSVVLHEHINPIHHFGIIHPPSRLIGEGFDSFHSLNQASLGNAIANASLAKITEKTINGQHASNPIQSYYNDVGQPPSRGYGIHHHHDHHHAKVHHIKKHLKSDKYNLIRGRGSIIEHKSNLPPALQSQPYGANFHMQNMLPPQYHKYNDGTNEF